ncbi:MAG: hypothetical protein HY364_00660 [Candidatus Aenigmarchaeota archaeon]|nr:hypothetical protein [Candidatus Aenigmarchaeota archaeon]
MTIPDGSDKIAYNRISQDTVNLDQHFLIDSAVSRETVYLLGITSYDNVLEVGPGYGNLARLALNDMPHSLYAIEKDPRFSELLSKELASYHNFYLITGDALRVPWPAAHKFMSNVPYRISEPLLQKLFVQEPAASSLILPLDFVTRIISSSEDNDYTKLAMMLRSIYDVRIHESIPPESFYPKPRVRSALVYMGKRDDSSSTTRDRLTRRVFLQRDKKLKNAIREGIIQIVNERGDMLTKRESRRLLNHMPDDAVMEMYVPQIPAAKLGYILDSISKNFDALYGNI